VDGGEITNLTPEWRGYKVFSRRGGAITKQYQKF